MEGEESSEGGMKERRRGDWSGLSRGRRDKNEEEKTNREIRMKTTGINEGRRERAEERGERWKLEAEHTIHKFWKKTGNKGGTEEESRKGENQRKER